MNKYSTLLFFLLLMGNFYAQKRTKTPESLSGDTLVIDNGTKDSLKIFTPKINDYQKYTQYGARKVFDTVFTVDKAYQFTQYNHQDNFGRISFSNLGEGFQNLIYERNPEQDLALLPTKKNFAIQRIQDIFYYDVKTPTTAFIYHNGIKNGGVLQSTYTQNIGKDFNFSIEYMGLRSPGLYQRNLAAYNHFIFTSHFTSKNRQYQFFSHYIHQNVNNEEHGGIKNLEQFTGGDSRFNNRLNLEVNLNHSDSRFGYRRYYFSQEFSAFKGFKLRHILFHQTNKYYFSQSSQEDYYASALLPNYATYAKKFSKNLSNTLSLVLDQKSLFSLDAGVRYQFINLATDREISTNHLFIPTDRKEERLGVVGNLKIQLWEKLDWHSSLEYSNGNRFGNYFKLENQLKYEPIKDYIFEGKLNLHSSAPSFNYLMNTSFYEDFNYNYSDFKNQNAMELGAKFTLKTLKTSVLFNYMILDHYAYFDVSGKPKQNTTAMNVLQLGGENTLSYHKFHLNTQALFQLVSNDKELLPLPNFIGRANLYYQSKAFHGRAELQTGIKVYYFSRFASRTYFPVLNEFVLSESGSQQIGGRPMLDLYFNMKVKRMMIFAEAQHLNTTFTKNLSFAAPHHPLYDFRVNLGIVWYIFH